MRENFKTKLRNLLLNIDQGVSQPKELVMSFLAACHFHMLQGLGLHTEQSNSYRCLAPGNKLGTISQP